MLERSDGTVGTPAPAEAPGKAESFASQRPPVRAVTMLVPVWGYRFVIQFLEFCLPTLLAPGNIPAVAGMLPCRFVVLTSEADESLIRSSAAWRRLEQICAAETHRIDDLITDGNHSATITLAFARAVRQTGEAMLDTAFIFLVSDYLVADGSLRTVVERIRDGASGVVAGNFQIIAEDAIPLLRKRIDPASAAIKLAPAELVGWSLAHLHPATVANMVNFGLSHNAHTNRLFWRVDEHTLIGRFYLMHMIGIRPEVTDFVVGASCDYSFIPEMCPAGNVVALTDSDEYLVVEMQPREHESKWLLPGPIEAKPLADSLSEWTTAQHRGNVANTLVYRAAEVPPNLAETTAQADTFVAEVRRLLSPEPHPFRHHHYWIGSLAAHKARTRRPLGKDDWTFLLGEATPTGGLIGALWRLRTKLFGAPPDVTRLHPRWPDYGLPLAALKKIIAEDGRTLLVARSPASFARWLTSSAGDILTLEADRLIEMPGELYQPLVGSFDACLIILNEGMLADAQEFIARTGPLLKRGGQIMIMITNERGREHAAEFARGFARDSARLLDASAWIAATYYVPASRLRWAIYRTVVHLARAGDSFGWRSPLRLAALAVMALPLSLATFVINLGIRATQKPPRGLWSSVFVILRPSPESAAISRFPLSAVTGKARASEGHGREGPLALARKLARYRFVAGLLAARHDVAEYGNAEVLGTEIVLQEVRKIAVYNPELAALAGLHRDLPPEAPAEIRAHDILSRPLPKKHDAIYSFDLLERVARGGEETYIRNLRDSLSRDHDILIVGTRTDAGPAQQSGEILVARSGAELKSLHERYFHTVFPFSMIEQVVHAGIHPAADYVLVVCCARKH